MSLNSIEKSTYKEMGLPESGAILREIISISREIPENVNSLNPSTARYLSGRFLKGMDMCGELLSIAVSHELKTKVIEKSEHGKALIVRSKNHGLKTAKEKEAYAYTDEIYLEAAEKHIEAKAFRMRVENMRKDFEKAHYLMKRISESDSELEANRHGSMPYEEEAEESFDEDIEDTEDDWLSSTSSSRNQKDRRGW